jgi:hypothetical protein
MKASRLKVGDLVRITDVAGNGAKDYYLHPETRRVYKKIIARNRPVRINRIAYGEPWYTVGFKRKDGSWEWHDLSVNDSDNNWEKVGAKRKNRPGKSVGGSWHYVARRLK